MTYDYGEGAPPRGQGQSWDQLDDLADADISPHSDVWPQRPSYEPRPPRAGEGRHGTRPYAAGYGGPRPQGWGDVAQRTGPYRGGEYGNPNQYGNASTYGTPGEYGAGPRRGPEQYGAARYQPQATFHEPGRADAGPKARRRSRKPLVFAIIFVVLVISGGAGWYYLQSSADRPPTEQDRRVADQKVDPVPLTATEVFGSGTIPGAKGKGSYKVLKTQASTDCNTAVGGAIAKILTTAGCTQVVRATLMSSDGALVITAGIFNLATETRAGKASAAIKTAVDTQKGRFSGLIAGGATNTIDRAAANLAWDVRGHYLVYCLIANADGSAIAADDSRTQPIQNDLVESYLGDVVIHKRETRALPTAVPSMQPS